MHGVVMLTDMEFDSLIDEDDGEPCGGLNPPCRIDSPECYRNTYGPCGKRIEGIQIVRVYAFWLACNHASAIRSRDNAVS